MMCLRYSANSTAGLMFAAQASSQSVGQVTLWPVAPGEGGAYSCHVIMIDSQSPRYRTFAVFVCECFATLLTVRFFECRNCGKKNLQHFGGCRVFPLKGLFIIAASFLGVFLLVI